MRSPHTTGEGAEGAPRIEQLSVQIVLQEFVRHPVRNPQEVVARQVQVKGRPDAGPLVEEFPVQIEDLDYGVCSVGQVNQVLRVDDDCILEVALTVIISLLTPF